MIPAAVLFIPPIQAQDSAQASRRFDIGAQPLGTALTILGKQGGLDILYENGVVDGEISTALSGDMALPQAVARMLERTGLTFRFTSARAVLIFPARRAAPAEEQSPELATDAVPRLMLNVLRVTAAPVIGATPDRRFEPYGRTVQMEIYRRLRGDPRTSSAPFRVVLAVHVDGGGIIRRSDVVRSTGADAPDDDIRRVIDGVALSAPPPEGMPQPIWFEIDAR